MRQVIDVVQARMNSLALDISAYESLNAQRLELEKAYEENPYSENGLEGYEAFWTACWRLMSVALSIPMKWTASSRVRTGYLSIPYWNY